MIKHQGLAVTSKKHTKKNCDPQNNPPTPTPHTPSPQKPKKMRCEKCLEKIRIFEQNQETKKKPKPAQPTTHLAGTHMSPTHKPPTQKGQELHEINPREETATKTKKSTTNVQCLQEVQNLNL